MKNILRRYTIYIIVTAFMLSACGGEIDDKKSVESAKVYLAENKLRAANIELKNALQANPKNAEARYLLGQFNLTIGDMAFAEKEFRKAGEAGWDEGASKIGQMRALINGRQFKKVLDSIDIKDSYSDSVRADMYGLQAFAEAAQGYSGLAKVSLEQAKKIDGNAVQFLITDIQFALSQANPALVESQLEKALGLYEKNAELILLHAVRALQKKDQAAAKADFEKIISWEPKNLVTYDGRKARIGLARLQIIDRDLDQAKLTLEPLFKQSPDDPEVNYLGALLDYELKNFEQAEVRILKVLKLAPEHANSQLLFGSVNFAQKDYQQAAYYIDKYLQKAPGNIDARKLLGRTYIILGQHDEATSTLTSGLQGSEDDAELLALVGLSKLESGDTSAGIAGLRKALKAAPENQALKNELAKAYITIGDTENAIKQLHANIEQGGNKNQSEVLIVAAHLRAKQYDEAINVALNILSRSPESIEVLSMVGNVFASSGDNAEARKYFTKALSIEPDNALATMLLAALEEVDGNNAEAEKLYKSIIKNDSASIDPLLALARLSEKNKDFESMVKWLVRADEAAPEELRPKVVLAEYYLRQSEFAKVGQLIKRAADISANDPAVLSIKGRMLMGQGRYNEALSPLTELVTRMPESEIVRALLGETYLNLNQQEDARRQLNLALENNPYYTPAMLVLARVEQVSKNYDQGIIQINKIIKIQPEMHQAYGLGGDISMSAKDYKAAVDFYEKEMSLKPRSSSLIKQSEALVRLSKNQQAITQLEQWLKENEGDLRVHQYLANAYLTVGSNEKAITAFESIYAEQPDNIVVINNLAWLYSLVGDARSLGLAEKAYNAKPEDSGIQDTYGWVLVQQGEAERGKRILQKVMETLSSVPEVRYHYAVSLMKTGEQEEARKILDDLLNSDKPFEGRDQAEIYMK